MASPRVPPRRVGFSSRRALAIAAGRAAGFASRALRRGGGTALPGVIGLRLAPDLVRDLGPALGHGCALITGTNGKTTTARLVAAMARQAGLEPLANRSGSNLMRGIATALMGQADPWGRLRAVEGRLGVFEVDEATLPEAMEELSPRAVAFTNLFRDQLDRYGEVDAVAARWRRALSAASSSLTVVLNADDPSVAAVAEVAP